MADQRKEQIRRNLQMRAEDPVIRPTYIPEEGLTFGDTKEKSQKFCSYNEKQLLEWAKGTL